jgi:hypothetical protein
MLHGYQYFKGMFITAYVITTRKTTILYIENLRPHIQIPHLTSTVIEEHTARRSGVGYCKECVTQ